jgi:hydroxymethylpyrimidine pyrophosphatase-like HAD family hydrolase
MIRLIGVDVDGTLLDSAGRLPELNREAIHAAVAAGIHVALVTGRSYPFARPVADVLPSSISLIVSNGAVERATDGTTLARRLLDKDVARTVLRATEPFRGAAALIFDRDEGGQVIHEKMDWDHPNRRRYWVRNRALIARSVPLEDALVEDPIQVMFNGEVETMRGLAEALQARTIGPGDRRGKHGPEPGPFAVSLTEYTARDFSLIDVTAPEATKGRALAWRAQQLGLSRDQVMAVGDNFNDLEMLEFAGIAVVMANAVEELKRPEWHVTGHQDAGGLALAIERFALRR